MDGDQPSRHKLNHSDVERNRRNKLKKEIDELKEVELLYDAGLNPVDKLSVLKCGVDIMRHITDDLSPRLYFLTPDEVFNITSKMNNVLQLMVSLPEMVILFISESSSEILGIESENLVGRRLTDLILSSNAEMLRRTLQLSQDDRETLDNLSNSEDPESIESVSLSRSMLLGFYVNRHNLSNERPEDLVRSRLHPARWYRFLHVKGSIQHVEPESEGEDSDAGGEGQLVFASYAFTLAASSLPDRSFTLRLNYDTLSITDSSEHVQEILGHSPDELIGNRVTDFMLPLEGEIFDKVVHDRRRNDTVYVYGQLRAKSGRLVKFQVKITSVRGLASASRHTIFFIVSSWTQIGYNSDYMEEMDYETECDEKDTEAAIDSPSVRPLFTLDDVMEENEMDELRGGAPDGAMAFELPVRSASASADDQQLLRTRKKRPSDAQPRGIRSRRAQHLPPLSGPFRLLGAPSRHIARVDEGSLRNPSKYQSQATAAKRL